MPHQCTNCGRAFADGSKEMLSGCPDCGGNKFQFSPDGFDEESPPEEPPDPTDRPDDGVAGTVGSAAATVRDIVSGSAGPDATSANPPADSRSTDTGVATDTDVSTMSTQDSQSPTEPSPSSPTATVSTATADTDDQEDIIVAESTPPEGEDAAQADARSDLVEPDDLPDSAGSNPTVETDTDPVEVTDESVEPADPAETPGTDAPATDTAEEVDRTVADEPDTEEADRPDLSQLRQELNDQFESIRIVDRGQYELNLMELYDRDEVIIALQEDGRYSIRVPEVIGEIDR